jgi:hypothetical protein
MFCLGVFLFSAILFFVLVPGVIVSLPPKGNKYVVAAVHALIFALIWHCSNKAVWHLTEGFEIKQPMVKPSMGMQPTMGNPSTDMANMANMVNMGMQPTMGNPSMGMQPTMGNPSMGMPTMGNPSMGMPTMGMSTMGNPSMGNPSMGMPTMGMPTMNMANMGMSNMPMPTMDMANMAMPNMSMPTMNNQSYE